MPNPKTVAPVSQSQFLEDASFPTTLTFTAVLPDGTQQALTLEKRAFSTGSYGWFFNGKINVNGLRVQVGCNATVVGSKERAAQDGLAPTA